METPQENEPELNEHEEYDEAQEEGIEIYSRRAVFGFAVFLGPIFGAVLLVINLFKAGLRPAAWQTLLCAIAFSYFTGLLAQALPLTQITVVLSSVVIRIAGALLFANYFFPKYFPDNNYYPRSITNALLVSVGIMLVTVLLLDQYGEQMLKQLK